jgi:SAM-dependent methyltransferase
METTAGPLDGEVTVYTDGAWAAACSDFFNQLNSNQARHFNEVSTALRSEGHLLDFYAADDLGRTVAAATQFFSSGVGVLWGPVMLPGFENREIAASVITTALQRARAAGCDAVVIHSEAASQAGLGENDMQGVLSIYAWDVTHQALPDRKAPARRPTSSVLLRAQEVTEAIEELNALQLPLHPDAPKNWDSLAALSVTLASSHPQSSILDAGGEYYSSLLPQLAAYGYKNLYCINLEFSNDYQIGKIKYEHGNIVRTRFENNFFDAVTCLSVVEHGVGWEEYFEEMARILKPKGILFTSLDYWCEPVDTGNKTAYGVPVKIFTEQDMLEAIRIAKQSGFQLLVPIPRQCVDRVVACEGADYKYTFMYFTLVKE